MLGVGRDEISRGIYPWMDIFRLLRAARAVADAEGVENPMLICLYDFKKVTDGIESGTGVEGLCMLLHPPRHVLVDDSLPKITPTRT